MPPSLTHDQCRLEMCCCCGGRAGKNKVTEALGAKVKKYAQSGWNPEVFSFPIGICEACRKLLGDCEREEKGGKQVSSQAKNRWESFSLEDISVPRGILTSECICPICKARKSHLFKKGTNKQEKKQILAKDSSLENARASSCTKCYQEKTGRGIPHPCTEASKKANLANLVLKQKEAGPEQIVSKVLKEISKDKDFDQAGDMDLKQMKGGNNLSIQIGKNRNKPGGVVDALTAAKIKKRLDLSDREMRTMLSTLKEGNIKVERNVMEILKEIGSSLEQEYENVKMNFERCVTEGNKERITKKRKIVREDVNVTIVKDCKAFIHKVIEIRGLKLETVKCRPVFDGGQGSFKVVVSVFDGNQDPEIAFALKEGKYE